MGSAVTPDKNSFFSKQNLPDLVFWCMAIVLLFLNLGVKGISGSEARWTGIVREMFLSGNFVQPTINFELYFDKPIVSYWFIALFAFFNKGVATELVARIPSALAALAAWKQWFRGLLAPLVAAVKTVPVASFIILALVWLNSRSLSLFISALMVLPPVYLNVLEGICRTDRRLLEMARVFRVPLGRRLRGIYLPQVMPYFRTAVSLGLGLCWKAGAAAEIIGLPAGSMGERLYTAKVYFQTADLFAWTVTIVAVSVVFERLFLALVDRLMGKAGL